MQSEQKLDQQQDQWSEDGYSDNDENFAPYQEIQEISKQNSLKTNKLNELRQGIVLDSQMSLPKAANVQSRFLCRVKNQEEEEYKDSNNSSKCFLSKHLEDNNQFEEEDFQND